MYKLTTNGDQIIRLEDNAFIPMVGGNRDYQEYLDWVAEGNTAAAADPVVVPVPSTITMRQCRLQLLADGDLAAVETAIGASTQEAQIEWQFASTVERDNVLFQTIATQLSKTEADIDTFFTSASAL
jgi:hypothetical protein